MGQLSIRQAVILMSFPDLIHDCIGDRGPLVVLADPASVLIDWNVYNDHIALPGGLSDYSPRERDSQFWWSAVHITCWCNHSTSPSYLVALNTRR